MEDENFEDEEYKNNEYDDSNEKEEKKKKLIKYGVIGAVVFIAFLIVLVLLVNSNGSKQEKEEITKSITLTAGDKYELEDKDGDYDWTSTDKQVAIVTNSGQVEALKEGDATITLTSDEKTITIKVHVDSVDNSVNLTSVKLSKNDLEMTVDDEQKLEVVLTPSNATNVELSWSSSNEEIVKVENGTLKAIAPGSCMITVKSSNGNTDTCLVKVKGKKVEENPDIESISFDTESMVLKKGINYTLTYEVAPSGQTEGITWESSDVEVAKVDYGVLETVGEGTTTITAKSGDIQALLYITVVEGDSDTPDVIDDGKTVVATEVTLNQEEISLKEGSSYTLSATVSPENTTNKNVTWKSNNDTVASVDASGNVSAKKAGNAEITVTTSNGIISVCKVTVYEEPEPDSPPVEDEPTVDENQRITLNISNVTLKINDTLRLVETVTPNNNVTEVTWESSNNEVATVDGGLVTAVGTGSTTITAKLPNGSSATCIVSVANNVVKVLQVSLNVTQVNLKINGSTQLTAKVVPANATNKTITWSSSDSSIARVDSNGRVTGLKAGTVKITAKASNGVSAKATVVVTGNSTSRPALKPFPTFREK